jgi:OFA family oxalate/formate antiporter-like MFS transporter
LQRYRLSATWPYDPKRVPLFYGWVIWLFSTLGILVSIPGQTMGMAVFTDSLIEVLGLTRTQLSMAYLMGTVSSALLLTRAGRWYDRLGGRITIAGASMGLAAMLVFISFSDTIAALLPGNKVVVFGVIFVGYFGVRFFGQGVLTNAAGNTLLVWFEKRRGLVTGARGIFVSLGFSLAPIFLAWQISLFGWRGALWWLAIYCAVFALAGIIFVRDNPQSCGVVIDGAAYDAPDRPVNPVPDMTLAEAQKTPVFWLYSLSLTIHSLLVTAITFHVVSIFNEAQRDASEAFGFFLPMAIVATAVNLVSAWLADHSRLKPFLITMLCCFLVAGVALVNLRDSWGYWLLVLTLGAAGGLWSVISNLAFIRYFGALHLGEVTGLVTATMVLGSAIGPALFSIGLDWSGSYATAEWLCMGLVLPLLVAAVLIPQAR